MKEKYYNPSLDEFHVGFEYQLKFPYFGYMDCKFGIDKISHPELDEFEDELMKIAHAHTRVKYLDKIDLADLGFNITNEETKTYGYYLQGKLYYNDNGSPRELDLWYSHLKDREHIYLSLKSNHFNGNCKVYLKNKSELKRLLKQMNIL